MDKKEDFGGLPAGKEKPEVCLGWACSIPDCECICHKAAPKVKDNE